MFQRGVNRRAEGSYAAAALPGRAVHGQLPCLCTVLHDVCGAGLPVCSCSRRCPPPQAASRWGPILDFASTTVSRSRRRSGEVRLPLTTARPFSANNERRGRPRVHPCAYRRGECEKGVLSWWLGVGRAELPAPALSSSRGACFAMPPLSAGRLLERRHRHGGDAVPLQHSSAGGRWPCAAVSPSQGPAGDVCVQSCMRV